METLPMELELQTAHTHVSVEYAKSHGSRCLAFHFKTTHLFDLAPEVIETPSFFKPGIGVRTRVDRVPESGEE